MDQELAARPRGGSGHRRVGGVVRRLAITFIAATASLTAIADQAVEEGFDQVLAAHVSNGDVDYPRFADDPRYSAFIDYLGQTNPESFEARDEKIAYLINAYNAFAIKGILDGSSPSTFFGRIGSLDQHGDQRPCPRDQLFAWNFSARLGYGIH